MIFNIVVSILIFIVPPATILGQKNINVSDSYLPSKDLLIGQWIDEKDTLTLLTIDQKKFSWSYFDTLLSISPYELGDSIRVENDSRKKYRYIKFVDDGAFFEILGLSNHYLSIMDMQFGYITVYRRKNINEPDH